MVTELTTVTVPPQYGWAIAVKAPRLDAPVCRKCRKKLKAGK